MTGTWLWPALAAAEGRAAAAELLPVDLHPQRGIWGKVHEAATDFRWIARSAAFGRGAQRIEDLLWVGAEEQPARAALWRAAGERWLAVSTYRSRAVDRAGRRDFCEKQVLEWVPRGSPPPAAAAALLLLPRVELFDDAIWWDQGPLLRDAPQRTLTIGDAGTPALRLDEEALTRAVERGLAELRGAAATCDLAARLAALYNAVLAGRGAAVLDGLPRPLSGAALGALLLPLPRPLADRLSVAGWLFAARVRPEQLATNWQVIVRPPGSRTWDASSGGEADAGGRRLAEALLAGQPPSQAASIRPMAPPEGKRQSPTPALAPGSTLLLTEPDPDAPRILREIYLFARAVDRRWLSPLELEQIYAADPLAVPIGSRFQPPLWNWIQEVAAQRPAHADPEQWQVKVDLLRALAVVLVPAPETAQRAGRFAGGRIPPLLYAPVFLAGPEMLRDRLGDEETYRRYVDESRRCLWQPRPGWFDRWLELRAEGDET